MGISLCFLGKINPYKHNDIYGKVKWELLKKLRRSSKLFKKLWQWKGRTGLRSSENPLMCPSPIPPPKLGVYPFQTR